MFTSRLNQYRDLKNPAASSGSGEAAEGSGRLSGAAKRRQEALERQRQVSVEVQWKEVTRWF